MMGIHRIENTTIIKMKILEEKLKEIINILKVLGPSKNGNGERVSEMCATSHVSVANTFPR